MNSASGGEQCDSGQHKYAQTRAVHVPLVYGADKNSRVEGGRTNTRLEIGEIVEQYHTYSFTYSLFKYGSKEVGFR